MGSYATGVMNSTLATLSMAAKHGSAAVLARMLLRPGEVDLWMVSRGNLSINGATPVDGNQPNGYLIPIYIPKIKSAFTRS